MGEVAAIWQAQEQTGREQSAAVLEAARRGAGEVEARGGEEEMRGLTEAQNWVMVGATCVVLLAITAFCAAFAYHIYSETRKGR